MSEKKDFSYYQFEVGRYLNQEQNPEFKPYEPNVNKLEWNVFVEDINERKIVSANVFELSWSFIEKGLLYAKEHYPKDFNKFAEHIRGYLQYQFWARAEYETIICGWPSGTYTQKDLDKFQTQLDKEKADTEKINNNWEASIYKPYPEPSYKIDVYTQVMMNWDKFIDYVWANKALITRKKLNVK